MKGLELSRAYFETHGKPMLAMFPGYADRIAAGLAGEGSECFGFDDALSRDHDFGPGFCLWLTREDYHAIGDELQRAYEALPGSFMGFQARKHGVHSGRRVGVLPIDAFFRGYAGKADAEMPLLDWMRLSEPGLATVTNGQVFFDPLGEFSRIREAFLKFYPEDVRLKKMAARAASMAQSGQYNYARCMRRGETVAALLALAEFVRHGMSMVFLLNRRYMPFYKWAHRALCRLPVLSGTGELFRKLPLAGINPGAWRGAVLEDPNLLNTDDPNVIVMEDICRLVVEQLVEEGLTDGKADFLAVHAQNIMMRIKDDGIRSLHILEG